MVAAAAAVGAVFIQHSFCAPSWGALLSSAVHKSCRSQRDLSPEVGAGLLEAVRRVACAHISPMRSRYLREGPMECYDVARWRP